jgi:hypothetical protein
MVSLDKPFDLDTLLSDVTRQVGACDEIGMEEVS